VALRHPDFGGRLGDSDLHTEKPFGNTDRDIWNKVPEGSDDENAREILDGWGNPVAYIPHSSYGQPVRIMRADGTEVEVHAVKKPNGVYYNQDSFQIISLGQDGKQDEDELLDDIENFTRVKE
jgi:hypothetical protein